MQKAIVLHCDILGFTELIKKTETEGTDDALLKLKLALDEAVKTIAQFQGASNSTARVNFKYKIFSDNLYASFSYDGASDTSFSDAVILCFVFARSYYSNMLDNGFLVRGAISYGSDYSDETVIFSFALVKAYELERDKACNPRILVENSLVEKVKQGLTMSGPVTYTVINNSILIDSDSLHFLNPFELAKDFGVTLDGYSPERLSKGFIKKHIDYVKEVMATFNPEKDGKILSKYTWLLRLLEWLVQDRKLVNNEPAHFNEVHFRKV